MKTSELKKICEDHVNDLITAIAETRDGQRFLDYLNFCARFHRYSFRNRILIWCYQPDATFVAGYKAWPKMGRYVKKRRVRDSDLCAHGSQKPAGVCR